MNAQKVSIPSIILGKNTLSVLLSSNITIPITDHGNLLSVLFWMDYGCGLSKDIVPKCIQVLTGNSIISTVTKYIIDWRSDQSFTTKITTQGRQMIYDILVDHISIPTINLTPYYYWCCWYIMVTIMPWISFHMVDGNYQRKWRPAQCPGRSLS